MGKRLKIKTSLTPSVSTNPLRRILESAQVFILHMAADGAPSAPRAFAHPLSRRRFFTTDVLNDNAENKRRLERRPQWRSKISLWPAVRYDTHYLKWAILRKGGCCCLVTTDADYTKQGGLGGGMDAWIKHSPARPHTCNTTQHARAPRASFVTSLNWL